MSNSLNIYEKNAEVSDCFVSLFLSCLLMAELYTHYNQIAVSVINSISLGGPMGR